MKCRLCQEFLHTILYNNEGNNKNINEYIWKLMTILTFWLLVILKPVFNSIKWSTNKNVKITEVNVDSKTKSKLKVMPPAPPPDYSPVISWKKLWKNFHKN